MNVAKKIVFLFFVFSTIQLTAKSQPIPVELMVGNQYLSIDASLLKKFSENSKFGFYHLNTLQIYYNNTLKNSFILQDLLFYEAFKNLRVVAGAFYGKPGFNATAGFQYNFFAKNIFFFIAPRINIIEEPSYDIITVLQYTKPLTEKLKLFTRLKIGNLFDAQNHIKSYQWIRIGLDKNGTQFGIAANFDENGLNPKVETNFGLFVRREIF